MTSTDRQAEDQARFIEVWNDLVSPRDLTWSLLICGGTTAAALLIATALSSSVFFWGLGGAVVGFVICTVAFSPKRNVRIVDSSTGPEHSLLIIDDEQAPISSDGDGDRGGAR